jgi:aminoglycoside phosphotransferase (APT) family kinase protein
MTHDNHDPYAIFQALGLTETTDVTPVYGGSDTAIWQVKRAGAVYALRVFGQGEHNDCEREHMVMQATLGAGLPVPQIHAACPSKSSHLFVFPLLNWNER